MKININLFIYQPVTQRLAFMINVNLKYRLMWAHHFAFVNILYSFEMFYTHYLTLFYTQ